MLYLLDNTNPVEYGGIIGLFRVEVVDIYRYFDIFSS